MNQNVLAAIIIAVGLVVAVSIYMYYSPFQQCVRAYEATASSELEYTQAPGYAQKMCTPD